MFVSETDCLFIWKRKHEGERKEDAPCYVLAVEGVLIVRPPL